jgi:hypothetical protein
MGQAAEDLLDGTCNPDGSWSREVLEGGSFKFPSIEHKAIAQDHRTRYAIKKLKSIGIKPKQELVGERIRLSFNWKGQAIIFWPFTGWHTGKSIKDGRGIKNLIKQLK